jgi:hypothetical protein
MAKKTILFFILSYFRVLVRFLGGGGSDFSDSFCFLTALDLVDLTGLGLLTFTGLDLLIAGFASLFLGFLIIGGLMTTGSLMMGFTIGEAAEDNPLPMPPELPLLPELAGEEKSFLSRTLDPPCISSRSKSLAGAGSLVSLTT